jgi:hypothetical protein
VSKPRIRRDALKRLVELGAIRCEVLLHVAGGREDGQPVARLHGGKQFRGCQAQRECVVHGQVQIVEEQRDIVLRQRWRLGRVCWGNGRR